MKKLKNDFLANTLAVAKGEPSDFATQVENKGGKLWDNGVLCFDGEGEQDLVISAGVHGNETAPIEIVNELVRLILEGELRVKQRVLFLLGNPPAIIKGARFVEENLNRLFAGGHQDIPSNDERIRAAKLEDYVRRFFNLRPDNGKRLHWDLHTAIRDSKHQKFAVYPFEDNKPRDKRRLLMLKKSGISTVLFSNGPTTTFSYFSANEFNANAFTLELGKVRPFGENDLSQYEDISRHLEQVIQGEQVELGTFSNQDFNLFDISQVILKHNAEFKLTFADSAANFTAFTQGEQLAVEGDTRYLAQQDNEVILFPNADVALGQRALLTAIPTEL